MLVCLGSDNGINSFIGVTNIQKKNLVSKYYIIKYSTCLSYRDLYQNAIFDTLNPQLALKLTFALSNVEVVN